MFKFYGYLFIFLFIVTGVCFSSAKSIRFIVLPPEAGADLQLAAEDLAEVITLRSGERPLVMESRWRFPKDAIFIGDSPVTVPSLRLPRTLSSHGSITRRGPENRIFLRARNEVSLAHGVYTLAHKEWGARWFLPRENTVFLVDTENQSLFHSPARTLMEPAFIARQLTGFNLIDGGNFSRRNRINLLFEYDHSLHAIFTGEAFDSHPELFSSRRGERVRPRTSAGLDPQPHLAGEATATFAAQYVLQYFRDNPSHRSLSLSINDNILFDDTEETRAIVKPLSWFRGKPNYTDLVFSFMNRVAEQVFDEGGAWYNDRGEPRYLTALAYYWAEAAPSFAIHPRVMPILTADRAQWHDPEYKKEDKELIEKWAASGSDFLGTWDYYMGPPLPYPRQYTQATIDSVRHLAANNTRMFYAAMPYVSTLHGPQAYLLTQLLWEPWQDTDKLLDDFYEHVFGPAAATMRSFYESFERERALREGKGEWIKFYKDEACIELFPIEFLQAMAAVLDRAAEEAAGDDAVLTRIHAIQRDFELTLIYHAFQSARRAVVESSSTINHDADISVEAIAENLLHFHNTRQQLTDKLQALFEIPRYYRNFRWLQPDWQHQSDPTKAALGAILINSNAQEIEKMAALLPDHATTLQELHPHFQKGFSEPLLDNPLLFNAEPQEDGRYLFPQPMPQVPGWFIDARPAEHFAVGGIAELGNRGIRFSGADVASFFTDVAVGADTVYLLTSELRYQASPDNRTMLQVVWHDADGGRIKSERLFHLPTTWVNGEALLTIPLRSPDKAARVRIRFSTSRQYPGDFLEIRAVGLETGEI